MISALLQSASLLGDACRSFNDNCAAGIEPNIGRVRENLGKSFMLATALSPHVGYDNTAKIVKKAFSENMTLKQAAAELQLVSEQQFEEWVKPVEMTRPDTRNIG